MTTPVNGPADVKPGDLVRLDLGDAYRQNIVIATVLRANASTLTVQLADGKTLRKAYEVTKVSHAYHSPKRYKSTTFQRLGAWDRWHESRPSGVKGSPTFGAEMKVVSVVVMAAEVRDRPDDVCAQIHALSAWLKSEPAKDEP